MFCIFFPHSFAPTLQRTGVCLASWGNFQPPYFIAACAHKQLLARDIIGAQSVLANNSLFHAAFDVPSLRRPCACGAEASDSVVIAKSQSKLTGCTSGIHTVVVCSEHAKECKSTGNRAILRVVSTNLYKGHYTEALASELVQIMQVHTPSLAHKLIRVRSCFSV